MTTMSEPYKEVGLALVSSGKLQGENERLLAENTFLRQEVIARIGSAAEEHGVATLQTGEAPSQQLKPKMPLLEDVLNHVNSLSVVGNCNVISRQVGAEIAYNFISRHFGR